MSRLKSATVVYVEWADSAGYAGGWKRADDISGGGATVHSVGWIHKETKTMLTLVSHIATHEDESSDEYQGAVSIVKSCITRRVTLRDPSRRK